MQESAIVFIDEQPVASIKKNSVTLVSCSNGVAFSRHFDLDVWRAFIDAEVCRLRAHDLAERTKVVPIKPGKGRATH